MTAIELKRVLKDSALILAVLAVLLAAIAGGDQDAYLAPALEVFLLLQASFLGWSLFERERQENAGEYMLTLPVSRLGLLARKTLPRLACAAVLLLAYVALHRLMELPAFLAPLPFAVLYGAFFFVSAALALSLRNFLSAFFLACLLLVGQVLLILAADNSRHLGGAILQAGLTAAVFPLLFAALFRGFDIRPLANFNRRFLPGVLLLAVAIAGAVWLFRPANWINYYIAGDGTLLRNSCRLSEVLPGKARVPACLVALREAPQGGSLLAVVHKPRPWKPCIQERIVSLDLASGSLRALYRIPADWAVAGGYPGEIGSFAGGAFLVLLRHSRDGRAMVVEIGEHGAVATPLADASLEKEINYAVFLSRSPLRLLLIGKERAVLLSGAGVRDIGAAETACLWNDRLLLFDDSGMSLYRLGAEPALLWRRDGRFRKVLRHVGGFESRHVLYREANRFVLLDLADGSETTLALPSIPFTYQERAGSLHIVFAAGLKMDIWTWRRGRLTKSSWEPGFAPAGIRVSPAGVLAFDRQRHGVYPFTD
jgi:hypothetical protein